uniref:Inhibitor_I42 domain-containing protein n=2 Tax=Caenorhabditis tropicalis TaxID=1561998 RepID=A0A1I7UHV4_9PELO
MANYEIGWVGTDIKFVKSGRMIIAEGAVINIPDEKGQYMFVDWKYTKNPPSLAKIPGYTKPLTTNVFVTRATVRPDVDKLVEMFKPGQRVKFVAREQAPNERGVCWRAALATDEYHEIVMDAPGAQGRPNYRVIPKAGCIPPTPRSRIQSVNSKSLPPLDPSPCASASSALPVQRPLMKPKPQEQLKPIPPVSVWVSSSPPSPSTSKPTFQLQKPPPSESEFDYFDTTKEACSARFESFAKSYRKQNPECVLSTKFAAGLLKITYLNQMNEELAAIRTSEKNY